MLSPSATGRVGARAAAVGLGSTAGLGRLGRTLEVLRRNGRRLQIGGGALLVLVGLALRPLIEGVELPL